MKRIALYFFAGTLSVLTIFSCNKDDGTEDVCETETNENLTIKFNPVFNGEPLELENLVDDYNGFPVLITLFKFYVYNLHLIDDTDKEHLVKDVGLVAYEKVGKDDLIKKLSLKMVAPEGKFKAIKFGIGVGEDRNKSNPGDYEREHPLSGLNMMHWDWNSGYIFLKVEGKTDATDDGKEELVDNLSFHTGLDKLYKTIELDEEDFSISKEENTEINIKVDLDKFFKSDGDMIDFGTERITNATSENPDLAVKFVDFYTKAFSLE